MFGRFMPREGRFFDLFNDHAAEIVRGAETLVALMAALNRSQEEATQHANALDAIESKADDINDEIRSLMDAVVR